MTQYELVLRRQGEDDEIVSMSADNLLTGTQFPRGGTTWAITKDDGPSKLPGHVVRFICEPAED